MIVVAAHPLYRRHPEVLGAARRASKGDGPAVAPLEPFILRVAQERAPQDDGDGVRRVSASGDRNTQCKRHS